MHYFRLAAVTIMEQLKGVYSDDQDPYEINMIDLITKREEMDSSHSASVVEPSDTETSYPRIQGI